MRSTICNALINAGQEESQGIACMLKHGISGATWQFWIDKREKRYGDNALTVEVLELTMTYSI